MTAGAIDRASKLERAVFVRFMAEVALAAALRDDFHLENESPATCDRGQGSNVGALEAPHNANNNRQPNDNATATLPAGA